MTLVQEVINAAMSSTLYSLLWNGTVISRTRRRNWKIALDAVKRQTYHVLPHFVPKFEHSPRVLSHFGDMIMTVGR